MKKKLELNDEGVPSRNSKSLRTFVLYCLDHPEQRFWQALRNWSGERFILKADSIDFTESKFIGIFDTFYWEGKNK